MVKDALKDLRLPTKPILFLGKGPSLDRAKELDLSKFYTVGVNETMRLFKLDVSAIPHLDDWPQNEEWLGNAKSFIAPYYLWVRPNEWVNIEETKWPLFYDNIYCYNLHFDKVPQVGDSPRIVQDGFQIHSLVTVFALLGVREMNFLGFDGGLGYAECIRKHRDIPTIPADPTWERMYTRDQFRFLRELEKKYGLKLNFLFKTKGAA